jgi:hypothetical protein
MTLSVNVLKNSQFSATAIGALSFFYNEVVKIDDLVKSHETDDSLAERSQGAQQIGFLFFFFVLLRDLRGCNEVQHSRWTFYEVVKI